MRRETSRGADWYDEQRAGLGDEFRAAVVDLELACVLERPRLYPVIYREVLRAIVRRFPISSFGMRGDDVVVLACLHSSRDQRLLRDRLG